MNQQYFDISQRGLCEVELKGQSLYLNYYRTLKKDSECIVTQVAERGRTVILWTPLTVDVFSMQL